MKSLTWVYLGKQLDGKLNACQVHKTHWLVWPVWWANKVNRFCPNRVDLQERWRTHTHTHPARVVKAPASASKRQLSPRFSGVRTLWFFLFGSQDAVDTWKAFLFLHSVMALCCSSRGLSWLSINIYSNSVWCSDLDNLLVARQAVLP